MPDVPAEPELLERLNRLEAAVSSRPAPHADEQLAQRVLGLLAEKAQQQRAVQAANPAVPGLVPVGRMIPNLFSAAPPGTAPLPTETGIRAWFISQVLGEFRLMAAMYFDPRYRLSRVAQFAVPGIVAAMVVNYLLFNILLAIQIPILTPLAERVVLIFFAVILYKILSREAARYKQVLDYLASYGNY